MIMKIATLLLAALKLGASAGRTSSPAGVLTVHRPSTGLTPIDLAINNRHVKLVRRLEQRSFFSGWLLMKVPKYMGLGSEWKSRWCVIMPRYPSVSVLALKSFLSLRILSIQHRVCAAIVGWKAQ